MRINKELIELHNQYSIRNALAVEDKFLRIDAHPKTLEELLWADFEYLAVGQPSFREHADQFVFTEVAGPNPNALVLSLETTPSVHVVCFRSPLLHLINSTFSKMWTLGHPFRHGDCLPEHEHILNSDAYSDTKLLAGFFNDLEVLFDERRLQIPIDPPHLASPYDYCERVEGARRFILGHELGHLGYNNDRSWESQYDGLVQTVGINPKLRNFGQRRDGAIFLASIPSLQFMKSPT
jgi:hypothetical protein